MRFSIQILIKKVLKNCFLHLLAKSWFWRMPPRSVRILSVKSGGCSQEEIYQDDECVYREAQEEVSCLSRRFIWIYQQIPPIEYSP